MQDGSWSRLKDVFGRALELPEDEREAYLERECGDDGELRRDVGELLSAHAAAAGRLGEPEGPGSRIGPYQLLQKLGEGGFGAVYMAEQREPLRRRVALKVIKLGMDTRQVIARFEAERQALAMMDHPGIAKVLDAGATETGRPYFVMELVGGVPITEFCDQNHLDTDERLELFLQVCRAVQHAHQKGIIHRDLKPSNVLVAMHDGQPLCKIIDFGIAKATGGGLTDKTLFTEFRQFIGTPQYMSPEQATLGGLDVDTRSDIYSLGVLLYELLTGEPPLDARRLREAAFEEMKRIITEEEPVRPSTRVSTLGEGLATLARARLQEPAQLVRSLRGDLDWIVLKALEKDRGRRYATASELLADIERHRRHEPVVASPPTLVYRTRKFVRRNRGPVAAGAALLLVLLLGIAATSAALLDARAGRALARESAAHAAAEARKRGAVADFLADVLASAGAPSERNPPGETSVVGLLDRAAAQLDSSALSGEPAAYASVATALSRAYDDQWSGPRSARLAARALEALGDGSADPRLYSAAARALLENRRSGEGAWSRPEQQRALRHRALELLEPGIVELDPQTLREALEWAELLPRLDPADAERVALRLLGVLESMDAPPVEPVLVDLPLGRALVLQGREEDARQRFDLARERLLAHLARGEVDVLIDAVESLRGDTALMLDESMDTVSRVAVAIRDAGRREPRTGWALFHLGWIVPWPAEKDLWGFCIDPPVRRQYEGLAESLFREALALHRESGALDHPFVCEALAGIAWTIGPNRFEERVATFREAVRSSENEPSRDTEIHTDLAGVLLLRIRDLGTDDDAVPALLHEADALTESSFARVTDVPLAEQWIWPLTSRWMAASLLAETYADLESRSRDGTYAESTRRWSDRQRALLLELVARSERPGTPTTILHDLARSLLTLEPPEERDPQRAQRLARIAVSRAPGNAAFLDTLAMAELECGDVGRAVEIQRAAVAAVAAGGDLGYPYAERLAEYEALLEPR